MNDIKPVVKQQFNIDHTSEQAKRYILHAKANNTIKSYKSDWKDFVTYCQARNVSSLSADIDTVINYVADMAETKKVSTIVRRLSSISQAHQAADCGSPTFSFAVKAAASRVLSGSPASFALSVITNS